MAWSYGRSYVSRRTRVPRGRPLRTVAWTRFLSKAPRTIRSRNYRSPLVVKRTWRTWSQPRKHHQSSFRPTKRVSFAKHSTRPFVTPERTLVHDLKARILKQLTAPTTCHTDPWKTFLTTLINTNSIPTIPPPTSQACQAPQPTGQSSSQADPQEFSQEQPPQELTEECPCHTD